MKSNWISINSNTNSQPNITKLAKRINKLIDWYDKNSTRKEDDYIKAHLKLIILLAENVENSDDIMFIEKMVDTFCDIIEIQREVISELEYDLGMPAPSRTFSAQSFVSYSPSPVNEVVENDEVKNSFIAFMNAKGKSPFTVNDYVLRIQKLWQSFYNDYKNDDLPSELAESVIRDEIRQDAPLLNAYNYIEELNCYLSMKIAGDSSRNWLNVRAALNIFGEALHGKEYEKVKVVRDTARAKDFSKYVFEGNTYGKSRLVLAVVDRYVKDHHPATFEDLQKAFPDSLQGSLGVVRRIEDVSEKYKGNGGVKRYFVDDIIVLPSGEHVIVCTQFGAPNTERFVEHAVNELRYLIEKI